MRRFAWPVVVLSLALLLPAFPRVTAAQGVKDLPHAFLFGSWIGGLYPPPTTLSGRECLASPTVIFTRDVVMRATVTDVAYIQRLIETVRDTGNGAEFRLVPGAPPHPVASSGMFNLTPAPVDIGFGCGDPSVLRVVRRSDNEISFPNCSAFPYPLVRCPGG